MHEGDALCLAGHLLLTWPTLNMACIALLVIGSMHTFPSSLEMYFVWLDNFYLLESCFLGSQID